MRFLLECNIYVIHFVQDTSLEKLDKKHFAKGSRGSEQNGGAPAIKEVENSKEIALMEAKMKKLCDLLSEVSYCCKIVQLSLILLEDIKI